MNNIVLKGVLKNIQHSHSIGDVDYDKADIIVKRKDGKEDILSVKFKKFTNLHKENDTVELQGNIRSYSYLEDGDKSRVGIYVFTYFDIPQTEKDEVNYCEIDGRICKKDILRYTHSGKEHFHFILANNIISNNHKLNSYIPCIVWGKDAVKLSEVAEIGTKLKLKGQLHSRQYTKYLDDGTCEFNVAHELVVTEYEVVEE